MSLVIDNKEINQDIEVILKELKRELGKDLFNVIEKTNNNISTQCPFHKDGKERHPSFNIYNSKDSNDVEYGWCKCFTCGYNAPLYAMIGKCFGEDDQFGKEWLIERFGNGYVPDLFPDIKIDKPAPKIRYSTDIDLTKYDFYHPYMWKRGLSREVVDRFRVGYDKETQCITFPVWDELGNLVTVTRRSVTSKKFYLESGIDKPIYLLNEVIKNKYEVAYVCESQINCLTLWGWGYPAIALFGTGASHQYEILKKSGIRSFVLCLDGDEAGDKGVKRFIASMPKDIFISTKVMPRDGRDINDLTKKEFDLLCVK